MNKILITFFTVLFCLTSSVGYSQNIICEYTGYTCPEVKFKDLVKQDGLFYMKFTQVPFNGKVKGQIQGSFRNGKEDGSWVYYYKNGQLSDKGEYKNGIQEGSWIVNNRDGRTVKKHTGTYKDGKKISD